MKAALEIALSLRFQLLWEQAKSHTAQAAIALAHVEALIELLQSETTAIAA